MLEVIRYPLRPVPLASIAVFVVLGWLLSAASAFYESRVPGSGLLATGLLLPFWFLAVGQLQCLGCHLLDAVARGHDAPTAPPPRALNPFESSMTTGSLLVAWATLLLVDAALANPGPVVVVGALVCGALAPACLAVMAVERSAIEGVQPRTIRHFVRGLGIAYVELAVAMALGHGALYLAVTGRVAPLTLSLGVAGYTFLVTQQLAGCVLFARRRPLALHTDRSPEQAAAAMEVAEEEALRRLFIDLNRLSGVHRFEEAYAVLDAYLAAGEYRNDERVHRRLREFQGRPLALEHACHYIERLVAAGKVARAWDVCRRSLEEDARFRPLSAATALAITRDVAAADAHRAALLLRDFARVYPDSDLHPAAAFALAKLELEHLGDRAAARALLRDIASRHPDFAREQHVDEYLARARR